MRVRFPPVPPLGEVCFARPTPQRATVVGKSWFESGLLNQWAISVTVARLLLMHLEERFDSGKLNQSGISVTVARRGITGRGVRLDLPEPAVVAQW